MEDTRVPSVDSQLLKQAFELSVVGTVITDACQADHPVVYVNPAFERLTGFDASEILGHNCRFLQGEDRAQPGVQEIRQALVQGQAVTVTLRNYRKDGTLFYNELTLSPLRDGNGLVTHFVGYQNDVTAREETALQVARTHGQLLSTLERVTDGFVSYDNNLNFIHLNAAAASIAGMSPADLIGKNLFLTFPEMTDSAAGQSILRAQETGMPQSIVTQLFGRWLDTTTYPADDGVSVFIRDVTERHQAEDQLRWSEERFNRIFQACPIAMIVSRVSDRQYIDANPEFFRQSGYTREEVIGRTPFDLNIWADPLELEEVGRTLQEQGELHDREVRFRLKSGLVADTCISVVPVMLGEEVCVVTLIRDISSEKAAQRILEESKERYREVAAELQRTLDLSLDLITTIDAKGYFVTASAACQQILGYAPEELVGHSFLDFVHPEDQARTAQEGTSLTGQHGTTTFQNRYVHKNGAVMWLEWAAVTLQGDPLMYCVARDITGRRGAEQDQAFLAAIVEATHNAVVGVGLDNTIRSWNPGAERLYGYTKAEAIGQTMPLIVPPELHAEEAELLRRAGQGEHISAFESIRIARDGRRVPVSMTVSPVLDAAGRVMGVAKVTRDISARLAADQEIQTLNADLLQQLRHVNGLREIDRSIASSADLAITLNLVLDNIRQQLGGDITSALILNPDTLALEHAAIRGSSSLLPQGTAGTLGGDLAGQVALSGQPLHVPDLTTVPLAPHSLDLVQREDLKAYYAVPLIIKGKVLGVIEVFRKQAFTLTSLWLEMLGTLVGQAAIAVENARLFSELERKNLELRLAYDETIEGWARALDLRDKETEGHSRRVTELTVALCQRLGASPEQIVHVRRGALLHDIGKMGIPDAVLLKPGPLTEEEWVLMRRHPEYAVALLSPIRFLRSALDIPQYHHEKWDGSGYPLGLSGEAIPLTARAFAVVDVYDALTSDRPYREAWTRERALAHIQGAAGTHFDPAVVASFVHLLQSTSVSGTTAHRSE